MSRISTVFEQLSEQGKRALIPFVTAGYPDLEMTLLLMHTLVDAGADIIELGVPFSDPMADGPTIQRASEHALAQGATLNGVLDLVRDFRCDNTQTPVVLMGYANPIEAMGQESFSQMAANSGVDGVLIVDYPPEESESFSKLLKQHDIDTIFLLAPTSSEERIKLVAKVAGGYVYYVSLAGVTGSRNLDVAAVSQRVPEIRAIVNLPVGVGFGIRDAKTAGEIASVADAVVIGSRIVEEIESASRSEICDKVGALISDLRYGVDLASGQRS